MKQLDHPNIEAARDLFHIELHEDRTVFQDFFAECRYSRIFVQRQVEGYGLCAHPRLLKICELLGIKDLHAKVRGSTTNYIALTYPFVAGLLNQETHQQLAERIRLHVVELSPNRQFFPRIVASPLTAPVKADDEADTKERMKLDEYYGEGRFPLKKAEPLPFYANSPGHLHAEWRKHSYRNMEKVEGIEPSKDLDLSKVYLAHNGEMPAIPPMTKKRTRRTFHGHIQIATLVFAVLLFNSFFDVGSAQSPNVTQNISASTKDLHHEAQPDGSRNGGMPLWGWFLLGGSGLLFAACVAGVGVVMSSRKQLASQFLKMEQLGYKPSLVNEKNLYSWELLIKGDVGTLYAGKKLKVRVDFPANYPISPPKIYMDPTIVFHPNVSPANGYVCMSTTDHWYSRITIEQLINDLQEVLIKPNPHSALNQEAALLVHKNDGSYERKVLELLARAKE